MNDEGDRGQCFSCGFLGHGVNHCTRLDRSFPIITPGWSVNLWDGKYRASKLTGDVHISTRGKEGWFGREGQPPGPSVTITCLTQVGVVVCLGNDRKMTLMDPDGPRMRRASQLWGALLRRKRTAAIVQYRSVQRWWIKIQNWTLSVVQRGGVGAIGLLWALDKSTRRQMRPAGNAEVVVLPGLTFIGKLVPVAAISVAMEDTGPPVHDSDELPEYLEEIVKGSHPSLADNSCGTSYCGTDMFFRRRGNQLLAGLRQVNMTSLRRTPDRSVVDQDGCKRDVGRGTNRA